MSRKQATLIILLCVLIFAGLIVYAHANARPTLKLLGLFGLVILLAIYGFRPTTDLYFKLLYARAPQDAAERHRFLKRILVLDALLIPVAIGFILFNITCTTTPLGYFARTVVTGIIVYGAYALLLKSVRM